MDLSKVKELSFTVSDLKSSLASSHSKVQDLKKQLLAASETL